MGKNIGCLVSIGTGAGFPTWGNKMVDFVRWLLNVATSAEVIAETFQTLKGKDLEGRYFRFNASGIENTSLQEWAEAEEIAIATHDYLEGEKEKEKLEACAKLLHRLKGKCQ